MNDTVSTVMVTVGVCVLLLAAFTIGGQAGIEVGRQQAKSECKPAKLVCEWPEDHVCMTRDRFDFAYQCGPCPGKERTDP